jgi:hypothetical protein
VTVRTDNQPRRGYPRTVGGLFGSLLAIFALIAGVWGLTFFERRDNPDPTPSVDFRPALATARAEAPFHVLAPSPLPAGLRATSVNWDGVGPRKTWQLGLLNQQEEFVGLYQGNGPAATFIAAHTPAADPGPPRVIAGEQWLTLTNSDRGETALVRTARGVTVVVTGTASPNQLVTFVRSLH